jgi:hypothetical protein
VGALAQLVRFVFSVARPSLRVPQVEPARQHSQVVLPALLALRAHLWQVRSRRRSVSDAQRESQSAFRLLWMLLVPLVLRMNLPARWSVLQPARSSLQAQAFALARC